MTDAQAAEQVLTSAKQIVSMAQLQDATGGYAFVSCNSANEPPYQVAVYMNFRLPQSNSIKYLRDVAASMVAHGWTPAPAMGEHFGQKLTKDGVTAIFYRSARRISARVGPVLPVRRRGDAQPYRRVLRKPHGARR